jgi:hypothetical protein
MLNFYFKANVVESVAGLRRGRQLPSVEEGGLMYIPLGGSGNIRYRHFYVPTVYLYCQNLGEKTKTDVPVFV